MTTPRSGGTATCSRGRSLSSDRLAVRRRGGQVSLGNLVAMGPAARNIVLVGDQMQLGQPIQGAHPEAKAGSALEYLLRAGDVRRTRISSTPRADASRDLRAHLGRMSIRSLLVRMPDCPARHAARRGPRHQIRAVAESGITPVRRDDRAAQQGRVPRLRDEAAGCRRLSATSIG